MTQELNLGKIITTPQKRDAIHIAVVPVIADERLKAGDRVALIAGSNERVRRYGTSIGVIDPFLMEMVEEGERCWLYLNPGSITSLRHDWTHPAFEAVEEKAPTAKEISEAWIREYAAEIYIGYHRLMEAAADWIRSKEGDGWGDYLVDGGTLEGVSTSPEFWVHYERVTGGAVPENAKENFFSCSC